jgi:hypothetical protein
VVAILGLFAAITTMMLSHVDVMAVALVFSLMGNIAGGLISVMLYGKMQKVETNTNGNMASQQLLVRELIGHVTAASTAATAATTAVAMSKD